MVTAKKIVGIMLVKNEEYSVQYALRNVAEFCDEIIVLDNMSNDTTFERVRDIVNIYPHISTNRIVDFRRSHRPLEKYAGTDTWVLGVDGDEIYDPVRMIRMRHRILDGEFDHYWRIKGHMLHVTSLEANAKRAVGYGTPPSKSVTKLYNFGALVSWLDSGKERLHGGRQVFRKGFEDGPVLGMYKIHTWHDCDLRCLHMCFVPRSSLDMGDISWRKNPYQNMNFWHKSVSHYVDYCLGAIGLKRSHRYKDKRYRRGPALTVDISDFSIDPMRPQDSTA